MKANSKAVEFIYKETEIHFLLGNEKNVMVNATEMAKAFGKEVDNFLRLESTKKFIFCLLERENSENIPSDVRGYLTEENIIIGKKRGGTYMHRKLALKFAAWLDVDFELWIIDTIDKILFGNYKKHWDAHVKQEEAKTIMETTKQKLLSNPTQEDAIAYFEAELLYKSAKSEKITAIQSQYKLFETLE